MPQGKAKDEPSETTKLVEEWEADTEGADRHLPPLPLPSVNEPRPTDDEGHVVWESSEFRAPEAPDVAAGDEPTAKGGGDA